MIFRLRPNNPVMLISRGVLVRLRTDVDGFADMRNDIVVVFFVKAFLAMLRCQGGRRKATGPGGGVGGGGGGGGERNRGG